VLPSLLLKFPDEVTSMIPDNSFIFNPTTTQISNWDGAAMEIPSDLVSSLVSEMKVQLMKVSPAPSQPYYGVYPLFCSLRKLFHATAT
jgi:hypothetical protein